MTPMTLLKMTDLDLSNKRVLIRMDLNVPIDNGKITSTKRIEAILPTLRIAINQGAKILLLSHLGRPKEGVFDPAFSLAPVATYLTSILNQPVKLIDNIDEDVNLHPKEVALLENVRFLKGEKENDLLLGKKLAALGDIFVMDAFGTAHRKEASTYRVAEFADIACAGPLLIAEMTALHQIMKAPARPLVAIVGGSKVSTKLSVLNNILSLVDCLIVGGGIANTFLAAKGYPVGNSLYEPDLIQEAKDMLSFAAKNHKNILLPIDVRVGQEYSEEAVAVIKSVEDVQQNDMILDVGPRTSELIAASIGDANTILWNGPLGVFEWDQFSEGTHSLAKAIAASSAYSVAGGGDTLAAIEKYEIEDKISYISTGGGAFLEYLEGKQLPAVAMLEQRFERR